jgi:glycosyltransferase involved in cell wall biosynthesis
MKQKKIIIFMPTIEGGGVEKNFFLITNYLSTKFKDISVISLSKSYRNKLSPKIKFITIETKLPSTIGRRTKFIFSLFLLFKKLLFNQNSTVFCFQGLAYCTILCKLLSTKIIIRSNSSPSGWSKNYIKKILYKKIYSMADKIIVNSKDFKKELKLKFNINSECIYNPLNKKEIIKNSKKKIYINFFKKKDFKIISVARLTDQKDHLCLIKSIDLLKYKYKNLKVLLIGSGNKKKEIQNLIDSLGLKKIIKILNFKKNPYPYIKKSDLFILSSNFEGLPNVLLEAITLKKFVISSDCPTGPSEILDNGKGGLLFKVGNYKELSKKIIYTTHNKKICNKKLLFAKKRLERFNFSKNLLKYNNILNTI